MRAGKPERQESSRNGEKMRVYYTGIASEKSGLMRTDAEKKRTDAEKKDKKNTLDFTLGYVGKGKG